MNWVSIKGVSISDNSTIPGGVCQDHLRHRVCPLGETAQFGVQRRGRAGGAREMVAGDSQRDPLAHEGAQLPCGPRLHRDQKYLRGRVRLVGVRHGGSS